MSNNTTVSGSCDFPLTYRVILVPLLVLTFILAPLLNAFVVLAVATTKKLQTPANGFIVSLSIGDILISISLPPMEMVYVAFQPYWPFNAEGTHIENWLFLFSLVSPFVTVMVITIDRYKAVSSLIRYRETVTRSTVIKILLLVWIYSIGSCSFMAYFFLPASDDYYEWNVLPQYYYPFLGLHIVIPLLVILILYIRIFASARATGRKAMDASMQASSKREIKLAKTVGIVVGLLILVWLPVLVVEYFYAIGTASCAVQMAGVVSVWLTSTNGMINPLVYSYRNPEFRRGMRKFLPSCFRNKPKKKETDETRSTHLANNSGSTMTAFSSLGETTENSVSKNKALADDTRM